MEQKERRRLYLKWPWNLVVYLALIVALRVFAIPLILLLMWWNQKQQPDGPEEGYCLQRIRGRLTRLVKAAGFLLVGAACGVTFYVQLTAAKTDWKIEDYGVLALAGLLTLAGIGAAVYESVTGLRDALFPEHSLLARSIRAQLPYPDEAPGVKELFAMVDRDIQEHGLWFDRVAVGHEWVLGDEATALSRVRLVFGRDEHKTHRTGGRTKSVHIVELCIMDDRRHTQVTALRNANELPMVLNCLKLRAPDALFRPYAEYPDYCAMTEEAWAQQEREYQKRRSERNEGR